MLWPTTTPRILRWLFAVACVACALVVLFNARWEGELRQPGHTWTREVGRSPVWNPPPAPDYSYFGAVFKDFDGFPAPDAPELSTHTTFRRDWLAGDLLFYVGVVSLLAGLAYLPVRKTHPDLFLHCCLWAGFGVVFSTIVWLAALFAFGYLIPGDVLGGLSLIAGVSVGLAIAKNDEAPAQPYEVTTRYRRRMMVGLMVVSTPINLLFAWAHGYDRPLADYAAAVIGSIAGSLAIPTAVFAHFDAFRVTHLGDFYTTFDPKDPRVRALHRQHIKKGLARIGLAGAILAGMLLILYFVGVNELPKGLFFVVIAVLCISYYHVGIGWNQLLFGRADLANLHWCSNCGCVFDPPMEGLAFPCPRCSRQTNR